ncbi:MAG: hypothetical protein AAF717_22930 [Bacteroidota bacterium]
MRSIILIVFIVLIVSCEEKKSNETGTDVIQVEDFVVDSLTGRAYDNEGNYLGIAFVPKQNPKLGMGQGLNGDIFYDYEFNSDGEKVKLRAFKYEYRSEYFLIDINNDTVNLGEEFIGYLGFNPSGKNQAVIETEDKEILVSSKEERIQTNFLRYEHRVVPDSLGIKFFKGVITIDAVEYPFEYKYVVIPSNMNQP